MKNNDNMILSAIQAASNSAVKVENMPEPPKSKESNNDMCAPMIGEYYCKPDLYLDTKDFSGVQNFESGKTVTLCINCMIKSTNMDENVDDEGEKKSRKSARLEILSIADLTDFTKK